MRNEYTITAENAKEYRKQVKDKMADRRMYAVQQVGLWVMKFAKKGIEGLDSKVGGRYRENMTFEEEAEFLEQFSERAESGQVVEVSEIKNAYDKIIGHVSGSGQIYYVLPGMDGERSNREAGIQRKQVRRR